MSVPDFDEARALLLEYAAEFLKGYTEAVDANYPDAKDVIFRAGFGGSFFPLHGRRLGIDVAIASFYTQIDFYLFFLDKSDTDIVAARSVIAEAGGEFGLKWISDTPDDRRIRRAREYLGLGEAKVLQPAPYVDAVNVPNRNFIGLDIINMHVEGHKHGVTFGNQAGARAESALPDIQSALQRAIAQSGISDRYTKLLSLENNPHARGNQFEQLWRDVLDLHGWRPKKFRIPGEENDFTAIYQGLHILGEVRWHAEAMDGGKMREFLAKLDPRPQTIGLFISHSGVDDGARRVVRRSVNTKTVVIFGQDEIEQVLREAADPGLIFDEKLRDAYDYILESSDNAEPRG
jgi:hypothetical protein